MGLPILEGTNSLLRLRVCRKHSTTAIYCLADRHHRGAGHHGRSWIAFVIVQATAPTCPCMMAPAVTEVCLTHSSRRRGSQTPPASEPRDTRHRRGHRDSGAESRSGTADRRAWQGTVTANFMLCTGHAVARLSSRDTRLRGISLNGV